MKKIPLILFIAVSAALVYFYNYNNNYSAVISDLSKKGELRLGNLTYRIYLLGILPVGDAVIYDPQLTAEQAGRRLYLLRAGAKTSQFMSLFFMASAELDSYIDTSELTPVVFRQKISIGGKKTVEREAFYDQKNNILEISGIKRQILPRTHDPLSLIYNFQHRDLSAMKDIDLNINTNQKNYGFQGTIGEKTIQVNKSAHTIYTASVEIKRRDKNPYHKSKANVVFLKTPAGNFPVLIKLVAGGILINARLIDIE